MYEKGRIEEAEALFAALLKRAPDDCRILNNLGVAAFAREDIAQSLHYFMKVLQIDPSSRDALANISDIFKTCPQKKELHALLKASMAAHAAPSPPSERPVRTPTFLRIKKSSTAPSR